ncbi:MAG: T9SS type A sorting domain-containing protein, partial [Ferruginibacter sp.]|nr:T9SS type A sorting domain-containing protein [Ferruginibacter sp.]
TSKDTVQVTVNAAANIAPLANAGTDQPLTLPITTSTITGLATDADGTISSYNWIKISGPVAGNIATANASTTTVNNLVQGIYQYELTVTDNSGATSKDTVQVTVNAAANMPPMADAGTDQTITLPINTTNLTGFGIDADGVIISYSWIKISGPLTGSITTANASTTVINNLVQGVYQYELTVTDNNGTTSKDTVQVTVNAAANIAPLADAGTDQSITLPINTTTLTGLGTDADGTISSYGWIKISGPLTGSIGTANVSTTAINNLVQGIYQYELTVTDNSGATSKDTVQVTVNAAVIINQLPTANAGNDIDIVLPTNTALLTGTGVDPDGTIVSYNWKVMNGPTGYFINNPALNETKIENLFQGVYTIEFTITDNNGAIVKDTLIITVSSPRLSNYSSNEFKVYPNPVKDIANLSISTINANTKMSVSVVDLGGRLVKYQELVSLSNSTVLKLDMSNLSNGYYIITVGFDDGRRLSSKVMKYGGN